MSPLQLFASSKETLFHSRQIPRWIIQESRYVEEIRNRSQHVIGEERTNSVTMESGDHDAEYKPSNWACLVRTTILPAFYKDFEVNTSTSNRAHEAGYQLTILTFSFSLNLKPVAQSYMH